MKNIVLQQDESDCGVACLAMILKHYKTEVPINKLREMSGTDTSGTSALGLKKCIESFNFTCKAIQADTSIFREKDLPLPLIAHVVVDKKYFHYVIIHKIEGDLLHIADHGKGFTKQTVKEFEKQ